MAKLSLKAGTTSKTVTIFVQDSSVTTGAGLTGLAFNTASLTAYYVRAGASAAAITLATLAAANSAWSSGGFKEIDATNMSGCYRLDIPDAALAAGATSVVIMLKGATNMAPVVLEIELTAVDNQSATAFVTSVLLAATGSLAMTESYAADGATPTLAQAIYAIQQMLMESNVSGTTLTVKKLDGVTSAMVFTLDNATNPTSITRAS